MFQQAADWIGLESRKSLWGQFWSAHQRFFKYLCIAAKVHRLVELAQLELSRDKVRGPLTPAASPQTLGMAAADARGPGRVSGVHERDGTVTLEPGSDTSSLQCVVIGLQSTGEARTREVLAENEGHLHCFVSAAE